MKKLTVIVLLFLSTYSYGQIYYNFSCNDSDTYRVQYFPSSQNILMVFFVSGNNGSNERTCESRITYEDTNVIFNHSSIDPLSLKFITNSYNPQTGLAKMIIEDATSPFNGYKFNVNLKNLLECTNCPERKPITVLHADATEFSDEWEVNYTELEDESTDVSGSLSDISNNSTLGNPYAFGLKGIWRPQRTSAYLIDRKQSGTKGEKLRINKDGEYEEFYWFDWKEPISYNESYNWRWINEVTKYNVNGASKEGRNRLNIHAASLFGYNNHLVTASASNSKTTDIASDAFEDYAVDSYNVYNGKGHGNLNFTGGATPYQLNDFAHTGEKSLTVEFGIGHKVDYNQLNENYFYPKKGEKYYISAWVSNESIPDNGVFIIKENGSAVKTISLSPNAPIIDGWRKLEGVFEISTSASTCEIVLSNNNDDQSTAFDDLRIQPFNSGMETYVYDPTNYRLRATLSNQNFATFYNYDEEGNLTQTKVETERGIKTISSNRNNIKN